VKSRVGIGNSTDKKAVNSMRMLAVVAGLAALASAMVSSGSQGSVVDRIAEDYVKLVLAVGQHDGDYVDAYYGPPEWKKAAESAKVPLADLGKRAADLTAALDKEQQPADELARLRLQYLKRQIASASARIRMLGGERLSFDDESKALYDAVAPSLPESHFVEVLAQLEKRFPGKGPLV
jgi:hypothetical protein